MTDFATLQADYNSYRQQSAAFITGWQPAPLTLVRVERQRDTLDAEAVQSALAALNEAQGWLQYSDRRVVVNGQALHHETGYLLAADLYQAGVSVRMRKLTADTWLWVHTQCHEADADTATHGATPLRHRADAESLEYLQYQQLWCYDAQKRLHVEEAVFVGFDGE